MTIPLWALLIPYGIILVLFVFFTLMNLYHLVRFGFFTFGAVMFFLMFTGASAFVLMTAWQSLGSVDWNQPLFNFGNTVNPDFWG